ncbi:hypothetical protein BS50DRAFT_565556 [Corynespora cassiicola Philippines]|uniref:Citrate transporter-like domain-containing protein n=1 Tax=Corynespora cassiicola Philippines TaxID=1448308 RepID=A0A2T2N1U8_CORCC|nr:hypothetical protein BS50DRAFT_565556 [Corynespora cassiicola Philippines]
MTSGSDAPQTTGDTSKIREWRSIVTLVVFVITNLVVLFPFQVPLYAPRILHNGFINLLVSLRIIPRKRSTTQDPTSTFVRYDFPLNFITAPLIADLFLLAILAIGRQEVHDGTLGGNNIEPLDIMLFFVSLAYIAISIDASGLIRYLAFKVLQWGGNVGHRLFFYLYAFFFGLTTFIGNDPIILSGTAFLAYMTRVSSNIVHPRAWIYTQFAVANIASAILVSSNPTNLVLAGAFKIKFINYTANIIVPVVATAVVLFPFLLYFVFADESLIPYSIKLHELPEEARNKPPVNPNIPNARGKLEGQEDDLGDDETGKLLSLEEIMNPFLDKSGAAFGAVIMAATLVTVLALNAASQKTGEHPVFWVTLPAAAIMFVFDLVMGWKNRAETREIARKGRQQIENAQAERMMREEEDRRLRNPGLVDPDRIEPHHTEGNAPQASEEKTTATVDPEKRIRGEKAEAEPQTLQSIIADSWHWCQETFPTAATVMTHLPLALVPFAFCMFVLVQALVTKGWVPVFAHGWDHWVTKTGTVGAIGGMGFLSVILSNFAGTNIGTSILLCRMVQEWQGIHERNGIPISDRTFWATVYSMALGVNYGAFSAAFSASLAGLLWKDILAKKHIRVHSLDFARVNLPIIAISMIVGCSVLIGQIYVVRGDQPYIQK